MIMNAGNPYSHPKGACGNPGCTGCAPTSADRNSEPDTLTLENTSRVSAAYDIATAGEYEPDDSRRSVATAEEVRDNLRAIYPDVDPDEFDKHATTITMSLAKINELRDETVESVDRWDHLREEAGVEFTDSSPVVNYARIDQQASLDDLDSAYWETYGHFDKNVADAIEGLETAAGTPH